MIHTLKIMESFADAIVTGDKTFEVRENDRGFQRGDIVHFVPLYNVDGCKMIHHPIRDIEYEITYVLNGWGIKEGYVVFGIKEYGAKEG